MLSDNQHAIALFKRFGFHEEGVRLKQIKFGPDRYVDEVLMAKYLDGVELTNDEIRHAIRVATCAGKFIPILCGASFKNKGVQALLDAVIDYLPAHVATRMA